VALLVGPSPPARLVRVFSGGVLTSIGRYSYAIYVVHLLVISQFVNRVGERGQLPRIAGTALPSLLLLDVVAFTSSYGIAWVTWRLYESPLLRLKTRFVD
jgi:peptidoglycan/LPS O-acetylase OafA/YrhL